MRRDASDGTGAKHEYGSPLCCRETTKIRQAFPLFYRMPRSGNRKASEHLEAGLRFPATSKIHGKKKNKKWTSAFFYQTRFSFFQKCLLVRRKTSVSRHSSGNRADGLDRGDPFLKCSCRIRIKHPGRKRKSGRFFSEFLLTGFRKAVFPTTHDSRCQAEICGIFRLRSFVLRPDPPFSTPRKVYHTVRCFPFPVVHSVH